MKFLIIAFLGLFLSIGCKDTANVPQLDDVTIPQVTDVVDMVETAYTQLDSTLDILKTDRDVVADSTVVDVEQIVRERLNKTYKVDYIDITQTKVNLIRDGAIVRSVNIITK